MRNRGGALIAMVVNSLSTFGLPAGLLAAATVHGYVVAAVAGAALLLVAVIPVAVLISAPAPPGKG